MQIQQGSNQLAGIIVSDILCVGYIRYNNIAGTRLITMRSQPNYFEVVLFQCFWFFFVVDVLIVEVELGL